MKVFGLLTILATAVAQMLDPIKCMNFYGLETPYRNLVCSWKNPPEWYLIRLKQEMGINTIRLPFSYEYIASGDIAAMDAFIQLCQRMQLDIILDWHRTWSSHQGATPEEGITLETYVSAWMNLLQRFSKYPNVKGVGLFNEIQLMNDFEYPNRIYRYTIPMLEAQFPNRFAYFIGCPSWGGNCSGVNFEDMPTWNRTFIEVHKYHFSGASDRRDWDVSIPARIPAGRWFVGEVGWKQHIDEDATWGMGFMQYLVERNISNVCLWTIAHSGDTDGWFKDDCETFDQKKADVVMNTIWKRSGRRTLRKNQVYIGPPEIHGQSTQTSVWPNSCWWCGK